MGVIYLGIVGFLFFFFSHRKSKCWCLKQLRFLWLWKSGVPEQPAVFISDAFGSRRALLFDELGARTGAGIISEYKNRSRAAWICMQTDALSACKALVKKEESSVVSNS